VARPAEYRSTRRRVDADGSLGSHKLGKEGPVRSVASVLVFAFLVALPQLALAADPDEDAEKEVRRSPFFFSLLLGDFNADDSPGQLRGGGDGYGWGLTAGYFFNRYFSVEGEFQFLRRDCERVSESVIPGTADNDQRYLTLGLSALAKGSRRFGRWRPFAGVGAGYFDTELWVTDPESGKFTRDGAPSSEGAIGYQIVLGVGVTIRKQFQLEAGWKTIVLDGDFGPYTNGNVDLGGGLIYIAARGGGL
jgi:opacity protein-like surface antigen